MDIFTGVPVLKTFTLIQINVNVLNFMFVSVTGTIYCSDKSVEL